MAEKQLKRRLKVLQSDDGGEYLSNLKKQILQSCGIVKCLTNPRNPHQNGVGERLNRTLMELVRALLFQKGFFRIGLGRRNKCGRARTEQGSNAWFALCNNAIPSHVRNNTKTFVSVGFWQPMLVYW